MIKLMNLWMEIMRGKFLLRRRAKLICEALTMKSEKMCYKNNSYAQLGEDRIIAFYLKWHRHLDSISYIDIGANHPFCLSNTALLDEIFNIKKGVLVEPDYTLFCKLKKNRKVICENIGVTGSKDGEKELTFYVMDADTLSTFKREEVEENEKHGFKLREKRKVSVVYINDLLKKYFENDTIEVISIDVEGMDYEIIGAIDFEKYKPLVICVETSHFNRTTVNEFMDKKGYQIFGLTCENTIYVRKVK